MPRGLCKASSARAATHQNAEELLRQRYESEGHDGAELLLSTARSVGRVVMREGSQLCLFYRPDDGRLSAMLRPTPPYRVERLAKHGRLALYAAACGLCAWNVAALR